MRDEEVGIVVAAYNAGRYLETTLESVRALVTARWSCVVVDDGSTDRTFDIATRVAAAEGRIRVVRQDNAGVGAARNRGVAELGGHISYLLFLDADDLLTTDALDVLGAPLRGHPEAVGVSAWSDTIDEEGRAFALGEHRMTQVTRMVGHGVRTRVLSVSDPTTFESLAVYGTIWPPATAVVRRSAFVEVGGFDEAIPQLEDWDLFLRMSRIGPLLFVDHQVAWYRRHRGNVTGNRAGSIFWQRKVVRKTYLDPANSAAQRRVVLTSHLRHQGYSAFLELRAIALAVRSRRVAEAGRRTQYLAFLLGQLVHVRPGNLSERTAATIARLTQPDSN